MRKNLIWTLIAIMGFISIAHAKASSESIICPIYYANSLKDKLPNKTTDKFKHCALSCQLALRCSAIDTMNLGILKEVWDLVSPGNAEWKDIEADAKGIRFAITKQAVTDNECNNKCNNIYWTK